MEKNNDSQKITRIALTGGPCGGKTSGLSILEQSLTNRGYRVFVVEEMATNIINSGAGPWIVGNIPFQMAVAKMQMERNKVYDELARHTNANTVILYDRGIIDGAAFIDRKDFDKLLNECGTNYVDVQDYYDGVFNLVTTANGAEKFYTLENNKARTETPEQAIELDNKLINVWTGHDHFRVIDNKNKNFKQKIDKLVQEVYGLLGIPVPLQIEKKYLIQKPNLEELGINYTKIDIAQTYLNSNDNVERRIRQRGIDGRNTFYYTEKVEISGEVREKREKKITLDEYSNYLTDANKSLHQIVKSRYCFVYDGSYFKLDIYPFSNDKAILEIELTDENDEFIIPKGINFIKDVTEDSNYKNRNITKRLALD